MLKNKGSIDSAFPLSQKEYSEVFKTYKDLSNERLAMLGWIQNKFLAEIPKKDRYRILSVGSGEGDFDYQLIRIFKDKLGFIEYIAVEPDYNCCQKCKILLDSHSINNFQYEIYSSLFEDFSSNTSFDLIHFTHSLYYIRNREQAILHALDMLVDDGRLLIFHQTSKGINQIQQKFLKQLKGNTDYMFSSVNLEQILNHHDIQYCLDTVDSFLDITGLCSKNTKYTSNLLNFFLESKVSMLSPEIISEVTDYIKSISFFDEGHRFMFQPVAIFSITRNKMQRIENNKV